MKKSERLRQFRDKQRHPLDKLRIVQDRYPGTPFDKLIGWMGIAWRELRADDPGRRIPALELIDRVFGHELGLADRSIRIPALKEHALSMLTIHKVLRDLRLASAMEQDRGKLLTNTNKRVRALEAADMALSLKLFMLAGARLAGAIVNGDDQFLRNLADAVKSWRRHFPEADNRRAEVLYLINKWQQEEAWKPGQSKTPPVEYVLNGLDPYTPNGAPSDPRQIRRILRELGCKPRGTFGKPRKRR